MSRDSNELYGYCMVIVWLLCGALREIVGGHSLGE